MRVLYVCSAGGHITEIMQIKKNIGYESILLSEKSKGNISDSFSHVYFVPYDRGGSILFSLLCFAYNSVLSAFLLILYRPKYIISTGSHVSVPICIMAKIFSITTIHIESLARVHDLSKSGKMIYRYTDYFFVQWPELLSKYPKAHYVGRLF